jgi:hypothetical protein
MKSHHKSLTLIATLATTLTLMILVLAPPLLQVQRVIALEGTSLSASNRELSSS